MPTSHPRHSITETPALTEVLDPLRRRLGPRTPSMTALVIRGAEAELRELEARERASQRSLGSFVARLTDGPGPDLDEAERIRRAERRP